MEITQPAAVFLAWMASPMGLPAPSSAAALTAVAPSIWRNVIVPATGSIREGETPWFVTLVRVSFHFWPVLATREPVVRSIFPARASGFSSMDASTTVAKLLVISAPRFFRLLWLARSEEHTSELQSP